MTDSTWPPKPPSPRGGERRNWGISSNGGFAYTGRVELYPLGRFKAKDEVIEGNYEYEERVKMPLAGAYIGGRI